MSYGKSYKKRMCFPVETTLKNFSKKSMIKPSVMRIYQLKIKETYCFPLLIPQSMEGNIHSMLEKGCVQKWTFI